MTLFDLCNMMLQVSGIYRIKLYYIGKLSGISVWGGIGCANEDMTSKSTLSGLIYPMVGFKLYSYGF